MYVNKGMQAKSMIANFSLQLAYNKIAKITFVITLAQLTNKESRFDFLKAAKRIRRLNEILKKK
jgi:hypothetical protein